VLIGSVITIGILTVFRKAENWMPSQIFANNTIVFGRDNYMSGTEIRELLANNGFSVGNISYRLLENGAQLEYRMTVRTMDSRNIEKLSNTFLGRPRSSNSIFPWQGIKRPSIIVPLSPINEGG